MDQYSSRRFGRTCFAAALAVMLLVPPSHATCCRAGTVSSTLPKNCCHASQHSAPQPKTLPSATHDATCGSSCDAYQCVCCRPGNQPTIPPTRTADNRQPDHTLAFGPAPATPSAVDAGTATISDPTAALGAVAIPHRILHCSWLI
jgi:hypothetical protein